MDSFEPKYKQLSEKIHQLILKNLHTDDAVPAERYLSDYFQVSRTTVRSALNLLEKKGTIKKIEKKGFILADNEKIQISSRLHLNGFYKDMSTQGRKVTTTLILKEEVRADEHQAERLEVAQGDRLMRLVRLREVQGLPYSLAESYIPVKKCPAILEYDFKGDSLWEYLFSVGIRPKVTRQQVYAKKATKFETKSLNLSGSAPALMVVNSMAFWNNEPIEESFIYTSVFDVKLEYKFD